MKVQVMNGQTEVYDVLIIGGGPAGLSAATSLARSLHTVVIFDSREYRNVLSPHLHGMPGWDHEDPSSIRTRMQKDLMARYDTTQIVHVAAKHAARCDKERANFCVEDGNGREWFGRKLVLATGVSDLLPDLPGYESCWVKGIFHCLTSQGFEERGCQSAGVLAIGDCANPRACHRLATQAKQLTNNVRVYTNGDESLALELTKELIPLGNIVIEDRRLTRLTKEVDGAAVSVTLEDGKSYVEGFLVHKPRMQVNDSFAEQLGLEMFNDVIKANPPFHETNVKGVFAIGDCASLQKVFIQALNMGSFACAGLAAQLQMEL